MATVRDIEELLNLQPNNLTARRWLKDPEALAYILDKHITWNEDHLKINEPHMMLTLEESVDYFLDMPGLIDNRKELS